MEIIINVWQPCLAVLWPAMGIQLSLFRITSWVWTVYWQFPTLDSLKYCLNLKPPNWVRGGPAVRVEAFKQWHAKLCAEAKGRRWERRGWDCLGFWFLCIQNALLTHNPHTALITNQALHATVMQLPHSPQKSKTWLVDTFGSNTDIFCNPYLWWNCYIMLSAWRVGD